MPEIKNKSKKSKTDSEKDAALIRKARSRASEGATYWKDNWAAAEDDLNFLSGDQWPAGIKNEREKDSRPCLVNNVLPTFVDQVLGDQRQNRPAIKVSPVDMIQVQAPGTDKPESLKISSLSGGKDYELAEVMTGLVKNIEYNCDAETSYDIAFQAALESSMGFLRVRTDYLAEDTFDQDVIIDHIENQFSVTLDPNAREHDYSDMNWAFIHDSMPKDDFEEKYPGKPTDAVTGESVVGEGVEWTTQSTVTVSEYFTREPVTKEMALLSDGRAVFMDEIEPVLDELAAKGVTVERTRKVKTFKVVWRLITGQDVLEGPVEMACTTIPVVPVWGKCLVIKKKKIFRSIIRHSKDAQSMANYWDSAATESVALAPKAPFIGTEGQVEGYEDAWENANTTNAALLTYVPQYQGDPGPRREQPASIPAAEITLSMNSGEKIKSTMGMFDASLGQAGNESSGKAIIARQRQGDRGSFAFIDNLSKAIEMAMKTYDTERVVRLKFQDETEDYVKLNEQILDEQTNEYITINDLNVMKYDVVVTTGPSYSTQRMEAAEAMIQFAQAVPNAAGVIGDLIALNMDWPGADKIAERLKKIVPPNVLTAEEREKLEEDMPEQTEPTPEQQVQLKELEARGIEAEADIAKSGATTAEAEADVVKAQLESAEAQAKLQVIQAGADKGDPAYAFIQEMVSQAIVDLVPQNRS